MVTIAMHCAQEEMKFITQSHRQLVSTAFLFHSVANKGSLQQQQQWIFGGPPPWEFWPDFTAFYSDLDHPIPKPLFHCAA